MAVNQKNITIASFNYLIEVSAIPYHIRISYLGKLLKRKNSSLQKNVRLLKYIYYYVDKNRINEWDPSKVSAQTGISIEALYTQKSRLLKGMREYYFRWKDKEQEILINTEKTYGEDLYYFEGNGSVPLMLEKARKMAEIGMMREAKCAYMRLEKAARSSNINQIEMYLIVSEIYEYLAYYYFHRRQKRKILRCISKLNIVIETIKMLNTKTTQDQEALFNIRFNFAKLYLYCIEWYTNPKAQMKNDHLDIVYSLSKKSNNYPYLLKILHVKTILELTKENYETARNSCREGFNIAQKQKLKTAEYTFASILYYINSKAGLYYPGNNSSILKYYRKVKDSNPNHLWTMYLENSIVMTYYPKKKKEILDIFHEQINSNIMQGDFGFSVYWKFTLDSELYNDELFSFFNNYNIHFKGYLEIKKIDGNTLDKIKQLCLNTECYHTKINDFGLTWLVYKLKLITYFFREDGFDYDELTGLLKTMEHLKKENKIIPGVKTYELLKLGFKILELQGSTKVMLNKFELKFKKTIDDFKKNPQELTITDYAIVSSLARRMRCAEITNIVKDFYRWIETKHNEILIPLYREPAEKKPDIYTIAGTEEAA